MLFVLIVVLVAGFCLSMFGNYLPKSAVPPEDYFFALFLLASGGFTVGWSTVQVFDPESRQDYIDDVGLAYTARLSPFAGLIGWLVGMALWIRHLHGWTPETLSFFVVNPFGVWMVSLAAGFCALKLMSLLTIEIVERGIGE